MVELKNHAPLLLKNVRFHKVSSEPIITLQASGTGLTNRMKLAIVILVLLRDKTVKLYYFCTCRERGGLITNS